MHVSLYADVQSSSGEIRDCHNQGSFSFLLCCLLRDAWIHYLVWSHSTRVMHLNSVPHYHNTSLTASSISLFGFLIKDAFVCISFSCWFCRSLNWNLRFLQRLSVVLCQRYAFSVSLSFFFYHLECAVKVPFIWFSHNSKSAYIIFAYFVIFPDACIGRRDTGQSYRGVGDPSGRAEGKAWSCLLAYCETLSLS